MPRIAARRDLAEPAIVEAIEKAGWLVYRLHTPCDLLCVKPKGVWRDTGENNELILGPAIELLEVKSGNRKPHKSQAEFLKLTGVPVVRTPEEALKALGAI